MTIKAAVQEILAYLDAEVSTLRLVPLLPPEKAPVFPLTIGYPASGTYERTQVEMRATHTIALEVHVARKELEHDSQTVIPLFDAIVNAIWWGIKQGELTSFINTSSISYTYGGLVYAGMDTFGFIININNVRLRHVLT